MLSRNDCHRLQPSRPPDRQLHLSKTSVYFVFECSLFFIVFLFLRFARSYQRYERAPSAAMRPCTLARYPSPSQPCNAPSRFSVPKSTTLKRSSRRRALPFEASSSAHS